LLAACLLAAGGCLRKQKKLSLWKKIYISFSWENISCGSFSVRLLLDPTHVSIDAANGKSWWRI